MASSLREEKTPFLPVEEPDTKPWRERPRTYSSLFRLHTPLIVAEIVLLALNIGLLCWNRYPSFQGDSSPVTGNYAFEAPFSPATSAIPYKAEKIDVYEPSPFNGEPRHEVDVAWSNLLRSTKIRVSEDEMRIMNKTSVALRDGSGYLGYPEALHQLHCVKRIYQYRHQDYYSDLDPMTFGDAHWDHCLEVLRRGIMCNADLTINTFEWNDGKIKGISSHPRTCKDWSAFEEWTDARALHYREKDQGKHLVLEDEEGAVGPLDTQ